jgi:hypothetical protein
MKSLMSFALIALLVSAPAEAQDFKWNGALAKGKTLEVRGVSGTIKASRASGRQAEVLGEKSARKSDPDDVEIRVIEHEDGVTICAVYPSRRGRSSNTCEPGRSNQNTDNNDVEVEFTVKVPDGVDFEGVTVNGDVIATDLPEDAEVATVNGDIEVTAGGSVEASTVNGSINATIGRAGVEDLDFTTVNGGIRITLPADMDADIKATTVNGSVESDFPVTVQGRMRRGSMQGKIGKGGQEIELTTVNGSIELRKGR